MMRIASPRSVCQTVITLCPFEIPVVRRRSSSPECSGSRTVVAKGSPKTDIASSKGTPCLSMLDAALSGLHSNCNRLPAQAFKAGFAPPDFRAIKISAPQARPLPWRPRPETRAAIIGASWFYGAANRLRGQWCHRQCEGAGSNPAVASKSGGQRNIRPVVSLSPLAHHNWTHGSRSCRAALLGAGSVPLNHSLACVAWSRWLP